MSSTLHTLAQFLSHVWRFATPWPEVHRAPLSKGFSRQEYGNGLSFPPPGDLPDPEIEPASPALAGRFFYHWAPASSKLSKPLNMLRSSQDYKSLYKFPCSPQIVKSYTLWTLGMENNNLDNPKMFNKCGSEIFYLVFLHNTCLSVLFKPPLDCFSLAHACLELGVEGEQAQGHKDVLKWKLNNCSC